MSGRAFQEGPASCLLHNEERQAYRWQMPVTLDVGDSLRQVYR